MEDLDAQATMLEDIKSVNRLLPTRAMKQAGKIIAERVDLFEEGRLSADAIEALTALAAFSCHARASAPNPKCAEGERPMAGWSNKERSGNPQF